MEKENQTNPSFDHEAVYQILNKIAIFGGFSDGQLQRVLRHLKKVVYGPDQVIYRQGDKPSHIYIVLKGAVKIFVDQDHRHPLELKEFLVGDCFGETSVLGIQSHSVTAIAERETELIVLERQVLFHFYEKDKEFFSLFILNIARETCRRLHQTDEMLLKYVLSDKQ
ncbi:MAG: cyclic nucleotide-binding domain-containing protein [Candidatus Omnitrophica bacterium]|nr:cyclic nucleotide-binding domain-containing protein [Candidatus Omnitrophota bacterium]